MEVKYDFRFENGETLAYTVKINPDTMDLLPSPENTPSEWTKLENHKCTHCPLKASDSPHCPVAVNLDQMVNHFKETKSMWKCRVMVFTEERNYHKETDLQTALFSIFGLVMATSSCPFLRFLKPMARFHLPFANMDETLVRTTSMYLLKQYFVAKDGGTPDIALEGLEEHYQNLSKVNLGIIHRIRNLGKGDTQSNAITILDSFSQMLAMEIHNDMSGLRKLVM